MKKKSLLFLLFFFLIIVALALCLIFNKRTNNDNKNKNLTAGEDVSAEANFTLASQNPIYMHINSQIEILDSFFVVTNASVNDITCEVCSYYNSDISKIKYENRKITASAIDSYKLKFSLKAEDKLISREVVVVVEDNPKITQLNNIVNVNRTYALDELFTIEESLTNYSFETNALFEVVNKNLITKQIGNTNANFFYIENGIKHSYFFMVSILVEPDFEILAEDLVGTLESDFCLLEYKVLDKNGVNALGQEILVEIADNSIVEYLTNTAPVIMLKINGVGTTTLTIKLLGAEHISKTIHITITN